MAPVTEVVLVTLLPNADYSPILESVEILARQTGCLAVRASRLHEEPDKVHYFIDWDSVDSHYAFVRNKEVYAPFLALAGSVMADFAPPYHVPLAPYPPAGFESGELRDGSDGAVMIGKAWFPGGGELTVEDMESVSEAFGILLKTLGERDIEFTGQASRGWSLEDDISYKGESSQIFLFAVKWHSIESYIAFRQSEEFGEICSAITSLKKLRELELCFFNKAGTDPDTTPRR